MNLVAPVTVLAVVFTFASSAAAQGFRGFATGGGSSSGSGQSGTTGSPSRSGTSGSGTITTTPGPSVLPGPGVPIQSTPRAAVPQVTVPRFVPPVVHGGVPLAPHGSLVWGPSRPRRHQPARRRRKGRFLVLHPAGRRALLPECHLVAVLPSLRWSRCTIRQAGVSIAGDHRIGHPTRHDRPLIDFFAIRAS